MRFLGFIFAIICFFIGAGIWISEDSLRMMCRIDCWINEILYILFGEGTGKVILGLLWILGGIWFLYQIIFKNKKKGESKKKPD